MSNGTATTPATTTTDQREGNLLATVPAALTAVGFTAETIAQVRQTLATGTVYGEWASQVIALGNADLKPVVKMNGAVIDYVLTGKSLQPFLDLIEKEKAAEAQAMPGHYASCLTGQCILQRYDDGETYFEHVGPTVTASITDSGGDTITLTAELGSDESLLDETPTVYLRSGDDDGLMFKRPELDQVIADLEAFVDGLHQLRRLMGQGKAK